MTTFFMAIRNLKKNFSFYSLYLISVAFVITVFFAFTSFSVNTVMLEKISTDGRVEMMCKVISVFLMIFVLFYMTYSNRFFLRRRTKELGIYALMGYRKVTILSLLSFENILVCLSASLIGIIFGAFAHKGIVFLISKLLNLGIDNSEIQLFNLNAIIKSAVFVFVVILILVISNSRFLYKTSLMNLVRYEKSAEKKMKFHKIPAILGFAMMLGGYFLALNILSGTQSLWITIGFYQMGLVTMFLVVIGTVLFIASFLPFIVQISKSKKTKFYTNIKIITTPNFIYRIRSNAKTLIMLTLLSAGTLTISAVMALTLYYPIASVERIAPSEIEFKLENNLQMKDIKKLIRDHSSDENGTSLLITDIYKVTASSDSLPVEYSLGASNDKENTENAIREGILALISPVMTSTDGLCVAITRCIPAARASWASRQIASSTSPEATIIRSASSSTIITICGSFSGRSCASSGRSFSTVSTLALYPFRSLTPVPANSSYRFIISATPQFSAPAAFFGSVTTGINK